MPRFPREDPKGGLGAVTSTVIQGRLGGRFFYVHLVGVTLQVVARPWGGGKRRAGCRVAHGCRLPRSNRSPGQTLCLGLLSRVKLSRPRARSPVTWCGLAPAAD